MASVPYEKPVGELCSECRPVSLGVQAHLRSFEVLCGGDGRDKKERGEEGVDGEGQERERDWGVEGEEIKKDLKALEEAFKGLDIKDTIDAGNRAKEKRKRDEGTKDIKLWKEKGEWVDVKTRQETLATDTTPSAAEKEEPPPTTNETKGQAQAQAQAQAPAEKKELSATEKTEATRAPAPALAPTTENTDTETKPSFFNSLLKIFKSDPSSSTPPSATNTDTITSSQAQAQNKPEKSDNTNAEPWVSIPADPDWDTVTQEEKKEVDRKLWKDKGEWIKVKTKQDA